MATNLVVDVGELLVESGGSKDYYLVTRINIAVMIALVLLVVILVEWENDVPGSDKVNLFVLATGAEVEAARSLGPGRVLS